MTRTGQERADSAEELDLRVEPAPALLRSACEAFRRTSRTTHLFGRSLADWQAATRAALLPETAASHDAPVILTGHQAGIWHAGILAKWFLAEALADAWGGVSAALVVEQDVNDAGLVAVPAIERDEGGERLVAAALPHRAAQRSAPTAMRRTIRLDALADGSGAASRIRGIAAWDAPIGRILSAVARHADRPHLAAQMAAANDELLVGVMARVPTSLGSLSLLRTPFGAALLEAMRADPDRCVGAYNRALADDPRAARPLRPGELPLWALSANGRTPVMADDPIDERIIAPRAFLMTAIARAALGDCFVHGTGGGRYERVTERWMGEWLGIELAPMVVATATLRLPLAEHLPPIASADAAIDALALTAPDLHRISFDPDGASGEGPSAAKAELLAAIAAAPQRSPERRTRYRALMTHIAERRAAHRERLEALSASRAAMGDRAASLEVARSRVWPWPLHAPERLTRLRDALRRVVELSS